VYRETTKRRRKGKGREKREREERVKKKKKKKRKKIVCEIEDHAGVLAGAMYGRARLVSQRLCHEHGSAVKYFLCRK
jgi:predicted phage gp36 major capsid-like protein